jgi:hypothetical protein
MNETPTNQASSAGNSGAAPSTSDEQLVSVFKGFLPRFRGTVRALQTADFWFLSTARHRVCSGGGVDAGDFPCPAPRRRPLRTPGALPHISLRDWFQDSRRTSSQSRFSRHVFRPQQILSPLRNRLHRLDNDSSHLKSTITIFSPSLQLQTLTSWSPMRLRAIPN